MPIRNPFRRAGAPEAADDSQRNTAENGFKDTTVSGAKPLQVKDPAEYKLSGETPQHAPPCIARFGAALAEWALTVGDRNQRQRRVPASKTPPPPPRVRCTRSVALRCLPSMARTWLTLAPAVPPTREARILALQVQCLDNIVEPPQSAERERALQHLARELRLVPEVICMLAAPRLVA
jgi:hypothetical protein